MCSRLAGPALGLTLLAPVGAHAGSAAYQACCDALGERCPAALQVVGPGTHASGAQVSGPWELSCDAGAARLPDASVVARVPLGPGVVITPISPRAAACFDASCALPPELCVRHEGARSRVVRCDTGGLPPDAAWRAPSVQDTTAVVIAGRVLRSPAGALPASQPPGPAAAVAADFELPAAPPDPCVPNAAMRDASNQQVEGGNEALVGADLDLALDKYRAAILLNHCNAFAWAALGDVLTGAGAAADAQQALTVATRLMPSHFHAWTSLGRAAERAGDARTARRAYERALEVRPDHQPAREALQGLR